MQNHIYNLVLILTLIVLPNVSYAALVGFNPAAQSVNLNDPVNVGVVISGLGLGTIPSLGTFDIDVTFDSTHLSFVNATFGDQLDLFGLGSITSSTETSPGVLNLFELSLDFPSDLNDFQEDSFTLTTITFNTLSEGVSDLNILINTLGDADGNPLAADVSGGSITITSSTSPVPIPASALLLFSGLVFMMPFAKNNLKQT